MKNLGILRLLLLLVVFSACRKDTNDVNVIEEVPEPGIEAYVPQEESITGGVIGFVVDEKEEPVADAIIRLNDQTYTTDAYGHFFVKDESMNALGTLVKVEKEGYFKGSRRFFPRAGATSRVKVQLLTKSFDDSFIALDGGTVTMSNGAAVDFSPGSIKTSNGDAYNGTVHVATKWMDPSLASTLNQMPGNLQGLNMEVEEMALGTYGMIAVELEGDAGEILNIADGSTAKITMPIPASMQANAPTTIPLWSYNETHGLWVEESTATLQNGAYVGEVSHFSFWNCDIPFEYVQLEMRLVDVNGNVLDNLLVTLTTSAGTGAPTTSGSGYTDQDGVVAGAIPAKEVLLMEVFDPCGVVLYSQNIGPFDVDTNLGDITVSIAAGSLTTVTGNLLDCTGAPLNNGLVIADLGGIFVYYYPTSSNVSMTFYTCASTTSIDIKAIDLTTLEQSMVSTVAPFVPTDLGDITVCGNQLQNYISVTIDGQTAIYDDPAIDSAPTGTYVFSNSTTNNNRIGFSFGGNTPGDYSNNSFLEYISNNDYNWAFQGMSIDTFEVVEFDTHLIGSFTGEVAGSTGVFAITCTFNFEL